MCAEAGETLSEIFSEGACLQPVLALLPQCELELPQVDY